MPLDDELATELEDEALVLAELLDALLLALEALLLALLLALEALVLDALDAVPLEAVLLDPLPLALVPELLEPDPLEVLVDPEVALLLLDEVSSLLPPTPPVPTSSPQAAINAANETARPETNEARKEVRCDMNELQVKVSPGVRRSRVGRSAP